jgi:hypothetical protein
MHNEACDSSFCFELKGHLYVTECFAIASNAYHRKLPNVLMPEVPIYQLEAKWLQTLNNYVVNTGSFKRKFYELHCRMFTALNCFEMLLA